LRRLSRRLSRRPSRRREGGAARPFPGNQDGAARTATARRISHLGATLCTVRGRKLVEILVVNGSPRCLPARSGLRPAPPKTKEATMNYVVATKSQQSHSRVTERRGVRNNSARSESGRTGKTRAPSMKARRVQHARTSGRQRPAAATGQPLSASTRSADGNDEDDEDEDDEHDGTGGRAPCLPLPLLPLPPELALLCSPPPLPPLPLPSEACGAACGRRRERSPAATPQPDSQSSSRCVSRRTGARDRTPGLPHARSRRSRAHSSTPSRDLSRAAPGRKGCI